MRPAAAQRLRQLASLRCDTQRATACVPPGGRHAREARHTIGWKTVRLASVAPAPRVCIGKVDAKVPSVPLSPM